MRRDEPLNLPGDLKPGGTVTMSELIERIGNGSLMAVETDGGWTCFVTVDGRWRNLPGTYETREDAFEQGRLEWERTDWDESDDGEPDDGPAVN